MAESFDVLIHGAGIGGLALAWRLSRLGHRVAIAEKSDRVGGVVESLRDGDYLLEQGPNSFSNGAAIMALLAEIGLADRAIVRPMREHQRFVVHRHRTALCPVPMGPLALLTTDVLTMGEKLAIARGLFRAVDPPQSDLSIGAFFRARLGDGLVDALLRPFLAGIYASDADRVSMESALPSLFIAAQKNPRLYKAVRALRAKKKSPAKKQPRALVSFPDGLAELPAQLERKLRDSGVAIFLSENGANVPAAHRVLAVPAWEAADLLQQDAPQLATVLRAIRYARLTVCHCAVREADLGNNLDGFGFLNARLGGGEGPRVAVLGMIFSDRIFPGRAPAGHRLFTCFLGGDKDDPANDLSDEEVKSTVRRDLENLLALRPGADFPLQRVHRWQRALPLYEVGHMERLRAAAKSLPPNLHLLSSFGGGISMPDRVERAEQLARDLHYALSGKKTPATDAPS